MMDSRLEVITGESPPPASPATPSKAAAKLAAAPHEYGFFAVMRLLEALYVSRPRFGRSVRPSQDALRLAQEPSVTHASATLAAYEIPGGGRPDRLLVHFLGVFGPDGPLPLHLTEYARDRLRNHNDPSFARFAD